MAFLEGYLVGLGLVVLIGPVFFTLLSATLQQGQNAGLAVALGIFVSDIICVLLCSFGWSAFFQNTSNQYYIGLVGAALLISFGFGYILRPTPSIEQPYALKASNYASHFTKGFLVNFVNPFVFLVWLSIIGMASGKYGFSRQLAAFLTAALLGILTTDSLKALFANHIKRFLTPKVFRIIHKSIGWILLAFGLTMLYRVSMV